MSAPAWMPLYVADFQADTIDLTTEEVGAYMILLMLSWQRGGSLPNDMEFLKIAMKRRGANMHGNKFNALVPPLLQRYFHLNSRGEFEQKRLRKELDIALNFSQKQRENVLKRWRKAPEMLPISSRNAPDFLPISSRNAPETAQKTGAKTNNINNIENATVEEVAHTYTLPNNTKKKERKKEKPTGEVQRGTTAASAPIGAASIDPETDLFRRGKEVLGSNAGGVIAKLLKFQGGKVGAARAVIEQASEKQNPREYVGAVLKKKADEGDVHFFDIPIDKALG